MTLGGVRVEGEISRVNSGKRWMVKVEKVIFGDKTELPVVTELISTVVHLVEKVHLHGGSQKKT